jgi:hypothetical protein
VWKRLVVVCLYIFLGLPLRAQSIKDFQTPTPLPKNDVLVLGFLGGWEPWDNENRGVRKLALQLREQRLPGVHVETISNHKRDLALELITKALDSNTNGSLEPDERGAHRIILYGQSFGGAAVVKLARQLERLEVPVQLTVQVDSVGWSDSVIPGNVAAAANFYQAHWFTVRGEREIRAARPERTRIIENTRFNYSKKNPRHSPDSWFRRKFGGGHAWMDADPAVWARVEKLILDALGVSVPVLPAVQ